MRRPFEFEAEPFGLDSEFDSEWETFDPEVEDEWYDEMTEASAPSSSSSVVIPAGLKARRCPGGGGTTIDRCKTRHACPKIPDLLCVTAVNNVPFEYVAHLYDKNQKLIKKRIIKHPTSKLFQVVDRVPNRVQQFTPEVGTALIAFLANMSRFGMPVAAILTMGAINCRCMKGTDNLSNHSFGDAIDITGVRWATPGKPQSTLPDTIIHNYNSRDQREKTLIRRINACLRLSFPTVLDYNYKRLPHEDHFHCDMNRKSGRKPRGDSTMSFVQEALTIVLGRNVPITGKFDQATQQALQAFSGLGRPALDNTQQLNQVLEKLFTRVAAGR